MYPYDRKWLVTSLLLPVLSCTTPIVCADDDNTETNVSSIQVLGNALDDSKVKSLGESLEVHYSLQNVDSSVPFDVYIAVQTPHNGFWFLQPDSTFIDAPKPYYQNLTKGTTATVLKLNLPNDLNLIGENTFYAALLTAITNVAGIPPAEWPWEKLSIDKVFFTRTK
ncbi:MAG: hypothetical protein BWK79_15645 [Beggiatoa sp. IS2]|nr:MAG: hypothetical protein BWK79_15645 [Beggiatoa sp. IS2]